MRKTHDQTLLQQHLNYVKSEIDQNGLENFLEEVVKISGHFSFLFHCQEVQQKVDRVGLRMIACSMYCVLNTFSSCLLLILERKGICGLRLELEDKFEVLPPDWWLKACVLPVDLVWRGGLGLLPAWQSSGTVVMHGSAFSYNSWVQQLCSCIPLEALEKNSFLWLFQLVEAACTPRFVAHHRSLPHLPLSLRLSLGLWHYVFLL